MNVERAKQSQKRSEQNRKLRSLSSYLGRLVVFCLVMMAVLMVVLAGHRINASMKQTQQESAHREIAELKTELQWFFDNHLAVLEDHAGFPLMVQSVMQPDANKDMVRDFMVGLNMLGNAWQETLLDFQGRRVHSTRQLPLFGYETEKWVEPMIEGQKQHLIEISEQSGQHYWRLGVPVIYNGLAEGVLVAEIPVNQLQELYQKSDRLEGIQVELIHDGLTLVTLGSFVKEPFLVEEDWPELGLTLKYQVDMSSAFQRRDQLLTQMAMLAIAVTVLMVILAIYFGRRYLIRPVSHLGDSIQQLLEGHEELRLSGQHYGVREMQHLADSFTEMSEIIRTREQALRRSNKELNKANEELRESQAQLVQSEKMASIGMLAAGVAHEINNPISYIKSNLTSLRGYAGNLQGIIVDLQAGLKDSPEALKILEQLIQDHDIEFMLEDLEPLVDESRDGVERVAEIVQSLKSFARPQDNERMMTNLNEQLDVTLRMIWNELKYHCKVHRVFDQVPDIYCNAGQLNQVFMNLILNASHAIEGRGDIYIRTRFEHGHVVVEIEDNGSGIDEENLNSLFNPFFTTKPVGKGTGLGLSVSLGIIEAHGGRIKVASKVGEGSCFSVILPVKQSRESSEKPVRSLHEIKGGVDD
mgnify:CR=1 FL=1